MAKLVLILHDDPDRRSEYCKILWYNGFDVEVADSLEQARAAATKGTPDLVLLGLSGPSTRGFELCRELRTLRGQGQTLPVLVLARHLDPDRARAARRSGCTSYLEEPVPPVEVLFAVERLIGRVVPADATDGPPSAREPDALPAREAVPLRVIVQPPPPPLRAVEAAPPPPEPSDPPPTPNGPADGLAPEPSSGA